MQALSIWPFKGDFCSVHPLNLELTSPCFSTTRRTRRWTMYVLVRKISCCGKSHISVGEGFFSGYSKLKLLNLCILKRGSFGASFAVAWALEQQAIGCEYITEGFSNSTNGLSQEPENKEFNDLNLDEQEEDENNDDENGGDKSTRVNVRALANSLQFAKTADDVEEILKGKIEVPLQVYSSMIRGFGIDNRLNSAMALVDWLKRKKENTHGSIGPNIYIYNSLLGALKQSREFEEVESIMNDMASEGIAPNIVTYNTLMGIYLEEGRAIEALNLFNEILEKNLSPSPASYSTALLAYRQLEDGSGALNFFIELREKYLKGELGEDWETEFTRIENLMIKICYQVMRRWLVKSENLSTKALVLLTSMDKVGLRGGRIEKERLVWACTREEHYSLGKELYNRIRESDSGISLSVCNHLIWLMGKAKKWWAALEIYEDLLDKGPKPNNLSYELIVSHFNILLNAAQKRGIWRWGVRLLNKMEDKGLKPGSREWNSVLVACSKAAETSAAIQIFKRMVEKGEKPTIISYGALLSALEKGELYDEALKVWRHMIKVGIEPNLHAYTIMASIYVRQKKFDVVDSIIRDMVASKVEPTVVTFNAIISGCAKNSMGSAAYEWFHRMNVQNITPNEITYEMLIVALSKDGKPRLAYDLYLRAQNEGLKLSSKAYDAVVESSNEYGASINVSVLGPRPFDKRRKREIRKTNSEFCSFADVPRRSRPFDRKEIYSSQTEVADK